MPLAIAVLLAVLAGVATFLSFPFRNVPDSDLFPLAWVGLVPLLVGLVGASPRRGFWLGWLMGTITNTGGFWWISGMLESFAHLSPWLAWPLTVLNAAYQGLPYAIFGWALQRFPPRDGPPSVLRVAALFTAAEYLFPLIFPWFLGTSQYRFLAAIQIAELAGVSGVTFVIVVANACLARVVLALAAREPPPWPQIGTGLGLCGLSLVYGLIRLEAVDEDIAQADKLKLGLVEANIGIWEKQAKYLKPGEQAKTLHGNLLEHQRMSRKLAQEGVDLVIWPESSYFPMCARRETAECPGLPERDMYAACVGVKRSDAFLLGATRDGRIAVWRELDTGGLQAPPKGEAGFGWSLLDGGVGPALHAAAALREDAVVVAGAAGALFSWAGHGLQQVPSLSTSDLFGVAVLEAPGYRPAEDGAPARIWAVGAAGTLLAGDVNGVHRLDSGTTRTLRAIAVWTGPCGRAKGLAVGEGGVMVAIDGDQRQPLESGVETDLFAVWAEPQARGLWAVGARGSIVRLGPQGLEVERSPTHETLRAVGGRGPDDVWAGGVGGTLLHRGKGAVWTAESFPVNATIVALAADPRGALVVATEGGWLWRRHDASGTWEKLDAPGLGQVSALAPLGYVMTEPIPRDARYLVRSQVPLPDAADFEARPLDDLSLPLAERTTVQRDFAAPILFGAITWEPSPVPGDRPLRYNTAVMLDEAGRVLGTYDKVYLLMFGEYMPLGDTLPFLRKWFPESGRFEAGTDVKVFSWRGRRVGVMICYEDILPRFNRKLLVQGPNLVINVTNDAWFGQTSEPYLHLALSVLRAVEGRLVLVRSTNTGVSAVVDPAGRITHQTSLEGAETLVAEVPWMEGPTIFARIGDGFAYAILAWVGLIVAMGIWRRRTAVAAPAAEADMADPPRKKKRAAT
jgi:apolipoprotein N-acyltransferase